MVIYFILKISPCKNTSHCNLKTFFQCFRVYFTGRSFQNKINYHFLGRSHFRGEAIFWGEKKVPLPSLFTILQENNFSPVQSYQRNLLCPLNIRKFSKLKKNLNEIVICIAQYVQSPGQY